MIPIRTVDREHPLTHAFVPDIRAFRPPAGWRNSPDGYSPRSDGGRPGRNNGRPPAPARSASRPVRPPAHPPSNRRRHVEGAADDVADGQFDRPGRSTPVDTERQRSARPRLPTQSAQHRREHTKALPGRAGERQIDPGRCRLPRQQPLLVPDPDLDPGRPVPQSQRPH